MQPIFIYKDLEKSDVYSIGFKSLGIGEHLFDYQIDNDFFKQFETEDVLSGSLLVKLLLDKNERFLSLDFNIEGHIYVVCDRCLEETKLEILIDELLYVKFGEEGQEDNVIFISEDEYQLDIGNILNDFITLSKPFKVVHSGEGDDVCNPTMIERIEEYREKDTTNSTWSELEKIRNKLSNK